MTPEDLVEIELIKRTKYRYLRCLDLKRFDELGETLTEDCVAAYSGGKYRYEGRDAIVAFLREAMGTETLLSSHQCHQPEIDLTGPATATGTWALHDTVVLTDADLTIRGAAFYTDTYRKVDGDWRISSTGYKRLYEEIEPRSSIPGLRLTASWWATGGVSEIDV